MKKTNYKGILFEINILNMQKNYAKYNQIQKNSVIYKRKIFCGKIVIFKNLLFRVPSICMKLGRRKKLCMISLFQIESFLCYSLYFVSI